MAKQNDDDYPTTGHDWDGIREYDKPMPAWWLWTFYATILFAVGYMIAYPAWPLITTNTKGLLGYTTRDAVEADLAAWEAQNADLVAEIEATELSAILEDDTLLRFANAGGAAVYRNNCSTCRGAGAGGTLGAYPSLLDDDWLWGGTVEDINQTIAHGVRWDADWDTRLSQMPTFGMDELLPPEDIDAVAAYVLSLSGIEAEGDLAKGAEIFDLECSACHGAQGMGDPFLGAPNLTDAIWLYGGTKEEVVHTINTAPAGVMPARVGRLTDAEIKQVAIYVHQLGGGE